jgi:hypothetical protein
MPLFHIHPLAHATRANSKKLRKTIFFLKPNATEWRLTFNSFLPQEVDQTVSTEPVISVVDPKNLLESTIVITIFGVICKFKSES